MSDEEGLGPAIEDYLRGCGYLTRGLVGDGSARIEFEKQEEDSPSVAVGVKEANRGKHAEYEIAGVRVAGEEECTADHLVQAAELSAYANKCFLAMPIRFSEEDKECAMQMGVGLLEVADGGINEVSPAKRWKTRALVLPKTRYEGLKLAQSLLKFTREDCARLARIFCRAESAVLGFDVGGIHLKFQKEERNGTLKIGIAVFAGPLKRFGDYTLKFGELADFFVKGEDDRYTFLDSLGRMFVLEPSEWRFFLRVLSKVAACHVVFFVGTARIMFSKCPYQDGLDLEMDFIDGRDACYEHHYSQKDLGMLTERRRMKEKQVIVSSEDS